MAEHFVIALNLISPLHNAMQKVPNFDFDFFNELLRDCFPKQGLLPVETIIVVNSNPTKFVHDERGPSSCPSSLNALPKFVFDLFVRVRGGKRDIIWR